MHFKLIINPIAGGRKGRDLTQKIIENLRLLGVSFEHEFSRYIGHATEIAKQSARKFDAVVAVGGDGTVNEVVNGIFGYDIPLGILPVGRGNDFFHSLSSTRLIDIILKPFTETKLKMIDLGKINNRYFINVAGVGFDALVADIAEPIRFLGPIAYLGSALIGLFKNKGFPLNIKIDDRKIDINALLVAIANGKYFGGGMKIAPDADLWDGRFDVCLIEDTSKIEILKTLPKVYKGEHITHQKVRMMKAMSVEISAPYRFPTEVDGEVFYTDMARLEVLPKSMPILVS
ncbi:MAG: diacylglycerol/lipid kinase family protein [bacterium]